MSSHSWRSRVQLVAWAIVLWAILVGLVVFEVLPELPRTTLGWAVLVLGGPPAYVAISWLGETVYGIGPWLPKVVTQRFSLAWFAMLAAAVIAGCAFLALTVWPSLRLDR